jgi:hypothetical protein
LLFINVRLVIINLFNDFWFNVISRKDRKEIKNAKTTKKKLCDNLCPLDTFASFA